MSDRLQNTHPGLAAAMAGLDAGALGRLAQEVIAECHARLSPEARDILADEGFSVDGLSGSGDPDLLDAAYLDAMEADRESPGLDLFSAARMVAAARYAAEAASTDGYREAIYEALIAADVDPSDLRSLRPFLPA